MSLLALRISAPIVMEDSVSNSSQAKRSGFPIWFRRVHSWWFLAQVGGNVIATWFIIRLVGEIEWAELGLGLLLGQAFLLSLWLALGGLPNLARFIAVLLVTTAGALAIGDQRWSISNWADWLEQSMQVFIICSFMVLLFHGLLLPLRWLLGWRMDFDPAYHAREKASRMQVGVVHFLGWTTFVAIPCAIIRLMPREDLGEIATICLSVSAMTLPVAASCSLALVGKKTWRWTLLALAVFVITWTAEAFIPGLVFSEHFLQFNLGIVAAVGGNLLVLRLFGLRLFSVVVQPADAAILPKNPVPQPHFAATASAHPAAISSAS